MRKLFILLVSAVLLNACSDSNSRKNIDPGFTAYISAFTSGVISNQSVIRIVLMDGNANAKPGEAVAGDLFSFSPSIEGQAFWVDDHVIEFRPNEPLPSGEKIDAKFELSKLMKVPSQFETLEFDFVIIRQSLFVNFAGIKSIGKTDYTKQELFGKVRTTDHVDPNKLEECVKVYQNGTLLELAWEHPENSKTHKFTTKSVVRGEEESFVSIEWNGKPIGADLKEEKSIRIPPLGEFTILKVNVERVPGVYFSIQCSDPVDTKQNLKGLIHLESKKELRLVIENNEIKAFPVGNLGNKETIIIEKEIINSMGNPLLKGFRKVITFNHEKPAIALLGDGVIMPTNGEVNFPFKAINVKAVNCRILRIFEKNVGQYFQVNQINGTSQLARVGRVVYDDVIDLVSEEALDYGVWNNYKVDINKIIEPEPGAIYRVYLSFEKYQSLYPCADSLTDLKPMKRKSFNFDDGASSNSYYYDDYYDNDYYYDNASNMDSWYEYPDDYEYSDRDNPCKDIFYARNSGISANILSSNYGIIAKESADDNYDIIITDLRTSEPISGVSVEAYNYQNQKIGEGKTNGDGVTHLITEGKPYLIVANQGKQKGYLRVDVGSALSLSLYEVGGSKIKKGIKGFIYGERGVWRPGDTLFLSFMLEDKLEVIPENHPIIMELFDPLGKLTDQKVKSEGVKGLYSFKFKTNDQAPTGSWRVKVTVGNSEFSKALKIETIKPNRLKINYDLEDIVSAKSNISPTINVKWLYGSPGANLKTRANLYVFNMKTKFKNFENYQFDDRSNSFSFHENIIVEGKTDSNGDVKLNFPWDKPGKAPGMLRMKFSTKVFEQGGDFSQDFMLKTYSPYTSYVGIKMAKGNSWMDAINSEESTAVSIATVDEKGNGVDRKVEVELFKMKWNWWWEGNGADELTRYINRHSSEKIKSDHFTINDGKGIYNLKFPKAGYGQYLLRVTDPVSGHSSSQVFYAQYPGWYDNDGGGENSAATILNIKTDEKSYDVGKDITVNVPSGGIGNIYVTVEKGDKVIEQFWVKASENTTSFKVKATEDMAPNVYVHATLIQPHGQTENSLPIRMYGVIPVEISDPNTHLEPVIDCANEFQPETTYEVKVSEKDGKAMAYTIAVVDEGLLSLTRFKTPEAWSTFYQKEALSVRTWDMYKYVMSAQTGKMVSLLAIGGDEGLVFKEDEKAKRFKPVVTYLGPFYLGKGDKTKHKIKIPNYIGAVRMMVVAGYNGAYGSAEKEVEVKQPLMVLSTLPRVLGPSETITIPINVITMKDNLKKVDVTVSSNDLLKPMGAIKQTLTFNKAGEQTVYFKYEVARKLGIAKFKVEVKSGKETAYEEVEIQVRAPNPEIITTEFKAINGNESWSYDYKATGIKGTNSAVLQISRVPNLDLAKQLKYLLKYPHGCIEQTTSAVFPQLYLSSFMKLEDKQKEEIDVNILAALNKYREFQQPQGFFAYWPGSSDYASEWGTNYAGHFMLEAKNKGYALPVGMLEGWIKFQRDAVSQWQRNNYSGWGSYHGDLTQAYRLYTLALAGKGDIGAMNRLKSDGKLSSMAAWRLAATYAIMGREDVAKELSKYTYDVSTYYRDMSYSFGSNVRDMAMILETMSYLKDYDRGASMLKDLASELNKGWHSTQTRAYSLLSIAKFLGGSDSPSEFKFDIEVNGKTFSMSSDLPVQNFEIAEAHLSSGKVKVKNNDGRMIFASLNQTGTPIEVSGESINKNMTMKVVYENMDGMKLDVSSLKQGVDFKALVTITHPGSRRAFKEVALNQIFPSGWQIVNTRVGYDGTVGTNYTYQDIRDDRVYTYFDLQNAKSKTFEILLNATFVGKYYQPAVFCAPMYDESIKSLLPGRWIEVVAGK